MAICPKTFSSLCKPQQKLNKVQNQFSWIIIIHVFYKAPFKALEVAVQHIKNSSRMDTIKKAEQLKSRAVCSRATKRGTRQAEARLRGEF